MTTHNALSATGAAVLAGTVHGSVHVHAAAPEAPAGHRQPELRP